MSLEPTNIRKEMTSDFRVPNDGGMGRVKRRMKRMKMNWYLGTLSLPSQLQDPLHSHPPIPIKIAAKISLGFLWHGDGSTRVPKYFMRSQASTIASCGPAPIVTYASGACMGVDSGLEIPYACPTTVSKGTTPTIPSAAKYLMRRGWVHTQAEMILERVWSRV